MPLRGKIGIAVGIVLAAAGAGLVYFPNPLWPSDRLIRCVDKNGNELHRLICVELLRGRARGSEKVLAALVLAMGDDWNEVRGAASAGLCSIGEPAVPYLQQALKDEDQIVRETAALTLNCIIPDPK